MSGFDALGVIASSLQIADLGTRVLRASVNIAADRIAIQKACSAILEALQSESALAVFVSSENADKAATKLRNAAENIAQVTYQGRWQEMKRWWRKTGPEDHRADFALALGQFNAEMSIAISARVAAIHDATVQTLQRVEAKLEQHSFSMQNTANEIKQKIYDNNIASSPRKLPLLPAEISWSGWENPLHGRIGEVKVNGWRTHLWESEIEKNQNSSMAQLYRLTEILGALNNLGGVLGFYGLSFFDRHAGRLRGDREIVIVTELAPNTLSSLYNRSLGNTKVLSRKEIIDMSISIARSISYIHACGIIHKNIWSNSIVLDANFENPKTWRFEFSRFAWWPSENNLTVEIRADAPEANNGHSTASDMFW